MKKIIMAFGIISILLFGTFSCSGITNETNAETNEATETQDIETYRMASFSMGDGILCGVGDGLVIKTPLGSLGYLLNKLTGKGTGIVIVFRAGYEIVEGTVSVNPRNHEEITLFPGDVFHLSLSRITVDLGAADRFLSHFKGFTTRITIEQTVSL